MKLQIKPEALKVDLGNLSPQQRLKILDKVEELEENPLSNDNVGYFEVGNYDMYRLKIVEGDLNHRALFDIEGETVVVYGFMIRDIEGYDRETLDQKVGKRR